MSTLTLTRTLSGFTLADDATIHACRKIKIGSTVTVELVSARKHINLRRWWALCGLIYENSDQYKSKEMVSDHLKILAGHCTTVTTDGGQRYHLPNSIAFSRLTEEEFQEVWQRVIKAVCEDIIPGMNMNDLTLEIMRLVGAAG